MRDTSRFPFMPAMVRDGKARESARLAAASAETEESLPVVEGQKEAIPADLYNPKAIPSASDDKGRARLKETFKYWRVLQPG